VKITNRRQCCHKNTSTWKVMVLTASDEGITTEGIVQNQLWPTHTKNDAYGSTDSYPGSCHPKSARTTDNIAVRAGLDLQSQRRSYASWSIWRRPIVLPYVKFGAEHRYKLLLTCAKNYQILLRRFKEKSKKFLDHAVVVLTLVN